MNTFETVTRFREVNADKVVYNLEGHSIDMPLTVTVTSELPVPRKGNPGTVKTFINIHRKVVLDAGTDNERIAPTVAKIEISLPLGSTEDDRLKLMADVSSLVSVPGTPERRANNPFVKLLFDGILPAGA